VRSSTNLAINSLSEQSKDSTRVSEADESKVCVTSRFKVIEKRLFVTICLNDFVYFSATSETFEKYARDGIDRTKGRDIVHYMAKLFKKDREDVRKVLSRHPNWCHVPVLSIKTSLDYLIYKKFSYDEIAENIILLLYPVPRIEQKLAALIEWKDESDDNRMISGVALSAISRSKLLNLCLYFIESEFHFSGDGIWDMNRHDVKQHDVFPTTIPEFPKTLTKVYRYGKKDQKAQITV
jgi:hypothetical protein